MYRRSLSGSYLLGWPQEKGFEIPKSMILIVDGSESVQRRLNVTMHKAEGVNVL